MSNSILPESSVQSSENNLDDLYEVMKDDVDNRIARYHERNTRRDFLVAAFGTCTAFGFGGMLVAKPPEGDHRAVAGACPPCVVGCTTCNWCIVSCVACDPCIACNPTIFDS